MHCTSGSPRYEGTASYSDGTPSQSVTEQFGACAPDRQTKFVKATDSASWSTSSMADETCRCHVLFPRAVAAHTAAPTVQEKISSRFAMLNGILQCQEAGLVAAWRAMRACFESGATSSERAHRATHRHKEPPVRALVPTLAVWPPHVCCRQRDWAVSIGSHMQQDMGISLAPPHLGALIPTFEHRSLQKSTIQKIGDNFPLYTVVFCKCPNACFPPRQSPPAQNYCCFSCCN